MTGEKRLWCGVTSLVAAGCLMAARPASAQVLDSLDCDGNTAASLCLSDEEIYLEIENGDWTTCQDCCDVNCGILCVIYDQFETCVEECYIDCFDAVLPPGGTSPPGSCPFGFLEEEPVPTKKFRVCKVWPPQSAAGDQIRRTRNGITLRLMEAGRDADAVRFGELTALQDKMRTSGLTGPDVRRLVEIAKAPSAVLLVHAKALSTLALLAHRDLIPDELRQDVLQVGVAGLAQARPMLKAPSIALVAALDPEPYAGTFQALLKDPNRGVVRLAKQVLDQLHERSAG